jgi:hypothetical protein
MEVGTSLEYAASKANPSAAVNLGVAPMLTAGRRVPVLGIPIIEADRKEEAVAVVRIVRGKRSGNVRGARTGGERDA